MLCIASMPQACDVQCSKAIGGAITVAAILRSGFAADDWFKENVQRQMLLHTPEAFKL
jgi:hypothetical protein